MNFKRGLTLAIGLGAVVYGAGCQKIGQGAIDTAEVVIDACDRNKQNYENAFLRAQQIYGDTNKDGKLSAAEKVAFRNKVFAMYKMEQSCPFNDFRNPIHSEDGSWVRGESLKRVTINIERDFCRRKR